MNTPAASAPAETEDPEDPEDPKVVADRENEEPANGQAGIVMGDSDFVADPGFLDMPTAEREALVARVTSETLAIPDHAALAPDPALVRRLVTSHLAKIPGDPSFIQNVGLRTFDLDDDSVVEWAVTSIYGCGSDGCYYTLYRTAPNVQEIGAVFNPEVLARRTRGMANLRGTMNSGRDTCVTIHEYDGWRYVAKSSTDVDASGRRSAPYPGECRP